MKNKIIVTLLVLFLSKISTAQTCSGLNTEDLIKDMSAWDWEVSEDDPEYCKTWGARTFSSCGSLTGICHMAAPWNNPAGDILSAISNQKDYTKEEGWVLIRQDFGSRLEAIEFPYFILYNKYRGLMRVFVFVNSPSVTYSSLLMTISYNNATSNRNPTTLATSNEFMLAQDKYFSEKQEEDVIIAVPQLTGVEWTMAEFRPMFDSRYNHQNYALSEISFDLYGIIKSDVILEGTSEIITEAYTVAGQKSEIMDNNGSQTIFNLDGAKITKTINTGEKLIESAKKLGDKFKKNEKTKDKPFIKKLTDFIFGGAEKEAEVKNGSAFFSKAGAVLSFVGDIIGIFSKDEDESKPPVFTPTISRSTQTLTGTIETRQVVSAIKLKIPGTRHNATTENLPFYDCPLGLINLYNTPQLDSVHYERLYKTSYGYLVAPKDYVSYRLRFPLNINHNKASETDVVSVQAALAYRMPENDDPEYDPLQAHSFDEQFHLGPVTDYHVNHILGEIEAGQLLATNMDPDIGAYEFQAPFRDVFCFDKVVINAPKEAEVFMKIKVILKKDTAPMDDFEPIVFIKNYKVDLVKGYPSNLPDRDDEKYKHFELPPYSNNPVPVPDTFYEDRVLENTKFPYTNYDNREIPQLSAINSIEVENVTVWLTGYTEGRQISLRAGNEIVLKPDFIVPEGQDILITTDYGFGYNIECADAFDDIVRSIHPSCDVANPDAKSEAFDSSMQIVSKPYVLVYPNSVQDELNIKSNISIKRIAIYNYTGQLLYDKKDVKTDLYTITGIKYPSGGYIVKVTTEKEEVFVKKILIE